MNSVIFTFIIISIAITLTVLATLLYSKRQWLLYYLVASFGVSALLIYSILQVGVVDNICAMEMSNASAILNFLGTSTYVDGSILYIPTASNWAIIECSLERSAILEIVIIMALIMFYIGFSFKRRVGSIIVGIIATYVTNIASIVSIALLLNKLGSEYEFLAHSVFARMLFFVFVLCTYWYLITKPSIGIIHNKLIEKKNHAGEVQ